MSFHDRPYNQEPSGGSCGGGVRFCVPPLTPMVKVLIIINVVFILLQRFVPGFTLQLSVRSAASWEIWRLLTFQFLHGGAGHLVFNMVALWMFGGGLEQRWGVKKFLKFYLTSGAVGGLIFLLLSNVFPSFGGTLVGASGGLFGILVACAILSPHIMLIIIPIRIGVAIYAGMFVLNVVIQGGNAGGDLCHLGGMATGFIWVMWPSYMGKALAQNKQKQVAKTFQDKQALQAEIDRILGKVHEHGLQSLTRSEKKTLQRATEESRKGKF